MPNREEIQSYIAKNVIEACGSVNKGGLIPDAECRDYAYKYKGNSCRYCITNQILKYIEGEGGIKCQTI